MATTATVPSQAFLSAFLPVARASLYPLAQQPITKRIPLLHRLRSSILLPAAFLPIPGIIDTIWKGILKAVPKKKTSHMKKRHRFMAGKALKDVTALNKCSSCGRLKRAHVLCPYCVESIKIWFGTNFQSAETIRRRQQQQDEGGLNRDAQDTTSTEEASQRTEARKALDGDRYLAQLVNEQAASDAREAKQTQGASLP